MIALAPAPFLRPYEEGPGCWEAPAFSYAEPLPESAETCLLCFQEPPLPPPSQHQQPGDVFSFPQILSFEMIEGATGGVSKVSWVRPLAAAAGKAGEGSYEERFKGWRRAWFR